MSLAGPAEGEDAEPTVKEQREGTTLLPFADAAVASGITRRSGINFSDVGRSGPGSP